MISSSTSRSASSRLRSRRFSRSQLRRRPAGPRRHCRVAHVARCRRAVGGSHALGTRAAAGDRDRRCRGRPGSRSRAVPCVGASALRLVVVAQQMQHAMHHQMREVIGEASCPGPSPRAAMVSSASTTSPRGACAAQPSKDSTLVGLSRPRKSRFSRRCRRVVGEHEAELPPAAARGARLRRPRCRRLSRLSAARAARRASSAAPGSARRQAGASTRSATARAARGSAMGSAFGLGFGLASRAS